MVINVWHDFSKRKNSTLQPSASSAEEHDVVFKEDTSIEAPSFIFRVADTTINYVQAFGHYYFVKDCIILVGKQMQINCVQDLLATHKGAILNSTFKVMYDTTANTEIPDQRLATKSTPTVSVKSAALRSDVSSVGSIVVALTGTNKVGSYVIPAGNLSRLMPDITTIFDTYISGTDPFSAIKDGLKQLVGSGQIPQNIRDVRWMPFAIEGDTLESPLMVGMYEVLSESGAYVGGRRIDTRISVQTSEIDIPWQFSDWRNAEPYTQIYLYIPFVGVVSYPASTLKGNSKLTVKTSLNKQAGDIAIEVKAGSQIVGTYGAATGVSVAMGSSNLNPIGVANSILAGVGAMARGNALSVAGAVVNAMQPLNVSVGGISTGAGSGLDLNIVCFTVCHDTVEAPNASVNVMGTPTMITKSLSSLTGYVQTENASINIASFDGDRDTINGMLNSGIYIE